MFVLVKSISFPLGVWVWILNLIVAAPVAEWLRSLTSVLLIIRSSHRCGFAPRTGHEFICETNRIHHGCPVEIGKSQPEGPPVPVGNEARRVSHWNGGPEGWDFPCSTGHP